MARRQSSDIDAADAPIGGPLNKPYTPPPRGKVQAALDRRLPDGWWLFLPMLVFLLILFVGEYLEPLLGEFGAYVASYVARTLIVAVMLVWLWPRLMGDVRWTHLGLGVGVGVLGLLQWVGMDKAILALRDVLAPEDDSPARMVFWLLSSAKPDAGHNLYETIEAWWLLIPFLAIRLLGPTLVVPVMEEVFWRNWLWRGIYSPNNYRLARVGEPDMTAFIATSLAFAVVHPQRLIAVVYGLLMAALLVRTKSLGAVIVAHAVTNLLLGVYVMIAGPMFGMHNEWYFW